MKIILNQDIHNLGEEGDVADVARGYARNFLLPQGLAVLHNKQNTAIFEQKRTAIEKRKVEKRKAALGLKERLQGLTLELVMSSGTNGRLFGSVTSSMIVDELNKSGITIEKKRIDVPSHSIKVSGCYTVKIKLYGDESAQIKVWINKEEVEAREKAAEQKNAEKTAAPDEAAEAPAAEESVSEETPEEEVSAEETPEEEVSGEETPAEEVSAEETPEEEVSGEETPTETEED